MPRTRRKRGRSTTVAGGRIETLCHTVNRVANELSWFHTSLLEFYWAVCEALQASDLPPSWIEAASTRRMVVEYQQSFRVNGFCLDPANLIAIEERMRK